MEFLNKFVILTLLTLLPFYSASQLILIEFSGLVTVQDDFGIFGNLEDSYHSEYATVIITYDTLLAPSDSNPDSDYGYYRDDNNLDWLNFSIAFNGRIYDEIKFDNVNEATVSIFDTWEPGVLYEYVGFSKSSRDGNVRNGEPTTNTPNTNFIEGEGVSLNISTLGGDLVNSDELPINMFGANSLVDPSTSFSFSYLKYLIYPDGTSGGGVFQSKIKMDSFQNLTVSKISVPEPTIFAIFLLGITGLASRRFMKKT